jgi:hypothetical protein
MFGVLETQGLILDPKTGCAKRGFPLLSVVLPGKLIDIKLQNKEKRLLQLPLLSIIRPVIFSLEAK